MKHADPVDEKAEVAAEPVGIDKGAVTSAYNANKAKVEEPIAKDEMEDLKFEDEVSETVEADRARARQELDAQQADLDEAAEDADRNVQETIDGTEAAADAAQATVDKAQENWEAHEIKKAQAEDAAVAGSLAGRDTGYNTAANMKDDRDAKQYDDAENLRVRQESEEIQAKRDSDKEFVKEKVARDESEDADYIKRNGEWTKAAEEKVGSDAAAAETDVEGPEGIYNSMTRDDAESTANAYGRETMKNENSIGSAAKGAWPKGQWPEEPNL